MANNLYLNRTMEGIIKETIEVKSSMTYHTSFEDSITKLSECIKTPIANKIIVYTGDFENTTGNIKVLNYRHLQAHLPHLE